MAAEEEITRFRIGWRSGAYCVSVPNYNGGEVVSAEYHDMVVNVLKQIVDSIPRHRRDWFDPDLEKAAKEIVRQNG